MVLENYTFFISATNMIKGRCKELLMAIERAANYFC
jgi:hypothetical protein